jgi:hypothetical protein
MTPRNREQTLKFRGNMGSQALGPRRSHPLQLLAVKTHPKDRPTSRHTTKIRSARSAPPKTQRNPNLPRVAIPPDPRPSNNPQTRSSPHHHQIQRLLLMNESSTKTPRHHYPVILGRGCNCLLLHNLADKSLDQRLQRRRASNPHLARMELGRLDPRASPQEIISQIHHMLKRVRRVRSQLRRMRNPHLRTRLAGSRMLLRVRLEEPVQRNRYLTKFMIRRTRA